VVIIENLFNYSDQSVLLGFKLALALYTVKTIKFSTQQQYTELKSSEKRGTLHMAVTIYHNPRCSKSRQTLQLVEENNIKPVIVEYLKTPPSKAELKNILNMLNMTPRSLLRKNEAEYKAQGLDDTSLSDDQIIDIMLAHPKLIERPIVVTGNKAALGRPPEKVLEII